MRELGVEYIAGFFDGEGCVSVKRDSRPRLEKRGRPQQPCYTLEVNIANTDRRPLDQLHARFGGDIRRCDRSHLPVYYWRVCALKAQRFLEWVRPWVVLKEIQVWLALEFMIARGLGGGKSRPLTPETLAIREGFYLALRAAKREVLS